MKIDGVKVLGAVTRAQSEIITPEALRFAASIARNFQARRDELLEKRQVRWAEIQDGKLPTFLQDQTSLDIRNSAWTVAPIRPDLECRFVEITGPASSRKMVISALNSGADTYMTDSEDSESPTWENIINGQINLRDAIDGSISFFDPKKSELKKLNDKTATLMYRPRGWHLSEKHVLVDEKPISASLFDFGLYIYHNAQKLVAKGKTPAFYLPKMESHKEAELWRDVFNFSEEELGIPHGTIRATVLIETILAAFEMDEILHGLKDYSAGLNAGRWDYLFSFIKKLGSDPNFVLPDRSEVTMDKDFLRSYVDLLVQTCHKRGIHAMGGMSALIPRSDDKEANAKAIGAVVKDKELEVKQGCDGAWVAHPGLVTPVREVFSKNIQGPNQISAIKREDVKVTAADLLTVPKGKITEQGLRTNINVSLGYLIPWLQGTGCVPINYKMEDLATVEISRSQLWQWLEHKSTLDDGRKVTWKLVNGIFEEEVNKFIKATGGNAADIATVHRAADLFKQVVNTREFPEFLSLVAYDHITAIQSEQKKETKAKFVERLGKEWKSPRWEGIVRPYTPQNVFELQGTTEKSYSLAKSGARELWELINSKDGVRVLSAVTGNQAIQEVQAGLKAIYVSGWQTAADANNACAMYPDQSLYPADSVPVLVKRINNALIRTDEIHHMKDNHNIKWVVPLIADAEAGFGGPLNAFEIMKAMIEAGASAVHFEDQLASEKKCGHMGGKVIVPTREFIKKLVSARLASDIMGVDTIIIARTDANAGKLITSDIDENDKPFVDYSQPRTFEGFYPVKAGIDQAISRALAYAPYADMLWCETSTPDLDEARKFAEAVHAKYPGKLLAYNCSPSFNWKAKLDDDTIAKFQDELNKMGYKFQFITLSGFHSLNLAMYNLAADYKTRAMTAYSDLQTDEFAAKKDGYRGTEHQAFVGTGYFDKVAEVVSGGEASTLALQDSTEAEQFHK